MTRDEVREWLTSDEAVVVLCRNRAMVPDDMTFVPTPNTACVARGHLRALADALPKDTAPEIWVEPEVAVRPYLELTDADGEEVLFYEPTPGRTFVAIRGRIVRLSPEAQDEIARWLVPGNDADEARRECEQLRADLAQAEQDAVAAGDRADQAERERDDMREWRARWKRMAEQRGDELRRARDKIRDAVAALDESEAAS